VIEVETLHHVSLSVTDLARAKQFYGQVLGLQEISRPPFDFLGAWYQLGDRQLHLIVHPGTRTLRGTTTIESREGHFGVRVRSYRETLEHLKKQGVAYRDRPRNLTPWPQLYVTDPDGNVIELNAAQLD
jgi:catechol 2,3-dioxygenase-like lactoylglutathione lyase family enzyme